MRIGFFTSMGGEGSAEACLRMLILGARDAGHTPVLFGIGGSWLLFSMREAGIECVAWFDPVVPRLSADESGDAEPLRGARQRILDTSPGWSKLLAGTARETLRLSSIFGKTPVDVMHINVHGYEAAGVACRLAGIPSVGQYHISAGGQQKWPRTWLIRCTARAYARVVGVSEAALASWVDYCKLDRARCRVVYNGLDLLPFLSSESEHPEPPGAFQILCVAKLHPMKGLDHLLDAMSLLQDGDVRLTIAGAGGLRPELEQQIARLGIESRVSLVGHVSSVGDLYRNADCFVLPSVRHEACPLVLIEAMASGLPLVTSDLGPLKEMNVDGSTGLVVPMGDASALAGAIDRLRAAPDECRRMGEAARERAKLMFDSERMVAEMLAVYKEAAGDGAGRKG